MSVVVFGILGLLVLLLGAEQLVRGASAVSDSLGVPPLIIGLTVLAFGTSAPEAAVSVFSAMEGEGSLSLGNALGSNIFNILFILGAAAAVRPLTVSRDVVATQVPIVLFVSIAAYVLIADGVLGRLDGALLLGGIVAFTYHQWRSSGHSEELADPITPAKRVEPYLSETALKGVGRAVFGVLLLVVGSKWLVQSALSIAETLHVSPMVAGLTVVAFGTSLPELMTSVLASYRGRADLAVGNVLGSNVFNMLFVLGAAGLAAPDPIIVPRSAITFDGPIMIATAAACFPVFLAGRVIGRWTGLIFVAYGLTYVGATYLRAVGRATPNGLAWAGIAVCGSLIIVTAATVIGRRRLALRRLARRRTSRPPRAS